MDRVWATITNPDALRINEEWAGHPGTLVKAYPAQGTEGHRVAVQMTAQGSCDATVKGWKLTDDGKLMAPPSPSSDAEPMCMLGHTTSGATNGLFGCPPATTNGGGGRPGGQGPPPHCLSAMSGRVAKDRHGFGTGSPTDPLAATTLIGNCPTPPSSRSRAMTASSMAAAPPAKPIPNTTTFTLSDDGVLKAGSGVCITTAVVPGPQLWYKPLLNGRAAILVVNVMTIPQKLRVAVEDVPGFKCSATPCPLRDVWAQTNSTVGGDGTIPFSLAPHQSAYYILG
eukprot:gene25490-28046_t